MKMREFHQALSKIWPDVCLPSESYKPVRVYQGRIEGVD
jgi:hypothetical protein